MAGVYLSDELWVVQIGGLSLLCHWSLSCSCENADGMRLGCVEAHGRFGFELKLKAGWYRRLNRFDKPGIFAPAVCLTNAHQRAV
jgi:hypothetical protein